MEVVEPTVEGEGIPNVMSRLSAHLDRLGDHIHGVEHAISQQFCAMSPPLAGTISQLQSLDYLRQSLEDLTLLTLLLSRTDGMGCLPKLMAVEISEKLNLNDTKALVFAQSDVEASAAINKDPGDLDLL